MSDAPLVMIHLHYRNGSFSMRQKLERSDENIRLQFPSAYSPLDKDILNLFTIGEKESTNEIRDSEDLVIEQVNRIFLYI